MLTKGIVPLFVTFAFINSLWTEKNFHSIFLWQVKKKKFFFPPFSLQRNKIVSFENNNNNNNNKKSLRVKIWRGFNSESEGKCFVMTKYLINKGITAILTNNYYHRCVLYT